MDLLTLVGIFFGSWLLISMYKDLVDMRKTVAENIDSHPHKTTLKVANNVVTAIYLGVMLLILVALFAIIKNLF